MVWRGIPKVLDFIHSRIPKFQHECLFSDKYFVMFYFNKNRIVSNGDVGSVGSKFQ